MKKVLLLALLSGCSQMNDECKMNSYVKEAFDTFTPEKRAYLASCMSIGERGAYCRSYDNCLTMYSKLGQPEQPMSVGGGVAAGAAALGAAHVIGKLVK